MKKKLLVRLAGIGFGDHYIERVNDIQNCTKMSLKS